MTELLPLLQEFYREKLASLLRHEAGARLVGQYDFNNTYQYIINREDTQLSWVGQAISRAWRLVPTTAPPRRSDGLGERATTAARAIIDEDQRDAQAFVDRWRPRVEAMSECPATRHAARHPRRDAGAEALLRPGARRVRWICSAGGRDHVGPRVGSVLPTRWIE